MSERRTRDTKVYVAFMIGIIFVILTFPIWIRLSFYLFPVAP